MMHERHTNNSQNKNNNQNNKKCINSAKEAIQAVGVKLDRWFVEAELPVSQNPMLSMVDRDKVEDGEIVVPPDVSFTSGGPVQCQLKSLLKRW
ncbi:unnamed protein product [Ambrosiozyma monospora]|uniref:Unnamed protein product n=1 Tax=Ambrosiozyma monospora TaxID=43982 RepID=A0A9W6Z233_AMBMO|nr:unnamed protein product [Ambrosiozyma monospora]